MCLHNIQTQLLKTGDFTFELPGNLIAQYPPSKRGQSRLMVLNRNTGKRIHEKFTRLPEILCSENFLSPSGEKPLLVFNDTKVRKARIIGVSMQSGAKIEFLLLDRIENSKWKTSVRHAKRRKTGQNFIFFDEAGNEITKAVITESNGRFCILNFENTVDDEWLDKYGHIPLPPYIKRKDTAYDSARYQTIYASNTGSAAAPTAGLHFTNEIFAALSTCRIDCVFLTLHVGLGTFLPVRCENIVDHIMHEEYFFITEDTAHKIEEAKRGKRKIVAVGTTSLRALESAICRQDIKRGQQRTSIFIYPGYKFKIVDALITNFHTPLSTLLMLVCAFAGKYLILESYAEAINEEYYFFSYGDAMLIY
jgi:S-adenosylmethionine:tRNA ribosyltransferase-isomerase